MHRENVEVFNRDAAANAGYGYTAGARLSSRRTTQRSIDAITGTAELAGRSVPDLGCGDGLYTARIWDIGRPRGLVALDAAIRAASRMAVHRRIAGFVPMFCPDALARLMKILEPVVERLPLVNALGCAVYVMVVDKHGRG